MALYMVLVILIILFIVTLAVWLAKYRKPHKLKIKFLLVNFLVFLVYTLIFVASVLLLDPSEIPSATEESGNSLFNEQEMASDIADIIGASVATFTVFFVKWVLFSVIHLTGAWLYMTITLFRQKNADGITLKQKTYDIKGPQKNI